MYNRPLNDQIMPRLEELKAYLAQHMPGLVPKIDMMIQRFNGGGNPHGALGGNLVNPGNIVGGHAQVPQQPLMPRGGGGFDPRGALGGTLVNPNNIVGGRSQVAQQPLAQPGGDRYGALNSFTPPRTGISGAPQTAGPGGPPPADATSLAGPNGLPGQLSIDQFRGMASSSPSFGPRRPGGM